MGLPLSGRGLFRCYCLGERQQLCQGRSWETTEEKSLINGGVSVCSRSGVDQVGGGSNEPGVQLLTQRAPKSGWGLLGPSAGGVWLVLLAAACASFTCRPLELCR
jgi:hypothetical protein